MALGDVVSGEKIFKKCAACHSINKGGKNKIGPSIIQMLLVEQLVVLMIINTLKTLASYGKEWTFKELKWFFTKTFLLFKRN